MTENRRIVRDADPQAASSIDLVVLGDGRRALALADGLVGSVGSITLVGDDDTAGRSTDGIETLPGPVENAADLRAIEDAIGPVDAVVATGTDSQALFAGYLARRELDPDVVIATVSDPDRDAAFSGTGIERLDVSALIAERVRTRLERASA